MLVETVLLIGLVLLLIYQIIRREWKVLEKWNIPHVPPSLRTIGHASLMFGKNSVEFELQCKKKFGNIWGYYLVTRPRIVVHDPEIIRHIMIKDFSTFPNRFRNVEDFGGKVMESGILLAHGARWKRMRSSLSPTFSNIKLKGMSGIVYSCTKNTLLRLQKMDESRLASVDIKDLFNRLSLDVIFSTVFSIDVNSQDDKQPEPGISRLAKMFFNPSFKERVRILLNISIPFLRNLIGDGTRARLASYFMNVCRMMMSKRNLESNESTSSRSDIMEAMINLRRTPEEMTNHDQKGLTDTEIAGNAVTMLLAGYDTTAVAMTYLAYNLAFHMDEQKKLQAEIDKAFPQDVEVDITTANNLKYLDMCINESMRLYCPIGRTIRCPTRDVTVSGLKIPKGIEVEIPIASLCRDQEFWEDPMSFKPERMKDMQNIDPVIYQPFGTGPRNCIGMKFAFMEIKLALCVILKKYTLKPNDDSPKPPLILKQLTTTSPAVDIKLELSPR